MDRLAVIELLVLVAFIVAATPAGAWALKKVLAWRQHTDVSFKESLISAAVIFATAGVFSYVSVATPSESGALLALCAAGMLGLLWLQSFWTGRIIHAADGRPIGTKHAFEAIIWMYLIVWIAYMGILIVVTGGDIFFFIIGIFRAIFTGQFS